MIDLSRFQPYIYPALPELSDMEFIANTRRACIEFCRQTQVWQIDLEPIDIVAGKHVYDLVLPKDAELSKVMSVIAEEIDLIPIAKERKSRVFGYSPCYSVNIQTKQIALETTPKSNVVGGLQIRVALKPAIASFQVPEILLTDYSEAISCGALGNLCSMVGRPFSDLQRAAAYREDFRHMINSATSDAAHGFSRANLNTKESYI
jgi:hypothetical protein